MADNAVTLSGNVTRDAELRFTQSGQAVANFGIAVNRRWQNRTTQEWEEKVSFLNCVAWGQVGENVAETLTKGARVIVHGRFDQRTWEDKEGNKRSDIELVVEDIGPSLKYATASITKNPKKDGFSDRTPDFDPGPSASAVDDSDEPF